ncbi:MAG: hypothetical protein FWE28_03260 [Oscillospiraceae bacterium]|nr:hypothetical protein [Oscillospiraceae bacterium]
MQSDIVFKKIWQDETEDLFELQMIASSRLIYARSSAYAGSATIDELVNGLDRFISGKTDTFLWEHGSRGGVAGFGLLSLKFFPKNKWGHILVEVYMELDDGGTPGEHNCCFYVETELGLLEKFCKRLYLLKEPDLNVEIMLNEL